MKLFRIETEINQVITVEYIVEAESQEEAEDILRQGEVRGEGEIVDEEIDWGTEVISAVELVEDLED